MTDAIQAAADAALLAGLERSRQRPFPSVNDPVTDFEGLMRALAALHPPPAEREPAARGRLEGFWARVREDVAALPDWSPYPDFHPLRTLPKAERDALKREKFSLLAFAVEHPDAFRRAIELPSRKLAAARLFLARAGRPAWFQYRQRAWLDGITLAERWSALPPEVRGLFDLDAVIAALAAVSPAGPVAISRHSGGHDMQKLYTALALDGHLRAWLLAHTKGKKNGSR